MDSINSSCMEVFFHCNSMVRIISVTSFSAALYAASASNKTPPYLHSSRPSASWRARRRLERGANDKLYSRLFRITLSTRLPPPKPQGPVRFQPSLEPQENIL